MSSREERAANRDAAKHIPASIVKESLMFKKADDGRRASQKQDDDGKEEQDDVSFEIDAQAAMYGECPVCYVEGPLLHFLTSSPAALARGFINMGGRQWPICTNAGHERSCGVCNVHAPHRRCAHELTTEARTLGQPIRCPVCVGYGEWYVDYDTMRRVQ